MSEEIVLRRRTKSLRQEAGDCALWLIENCPLVLAHAGRLVAEHGDEFNSVHWDLGKMDERERYETVIALKKGVQGDASGHNDQ